MAAGVAVAALSAVATTRDWLSIEVGAGLVSQDVLAGLRAASPLGSALSLVVLAAWGTVLVTRRRARRVAALVAAGASAILAMVIVTWLLGAVESAREGLSVAGVAEHDVGLGVWVWGALSCSLGSLALSLAAYTSAPGWPEMGSRYDAPGPRSTEPPVIDLDAPMAVWKAMDEGRDPTIGPSA